jgi:cell division protein FtsZ
MTYNQYIRENKMTADRVNFQFEKKQGSIIKVIGVGGGGGNAVNHMYKQGIRDVDFVICNTDAQALINSPVPVKVQLGPSLTGGNGVGNKPEIGRQAAIENIDDVKNVLQPHTKMVFITAGMGGGTGTGGAPVIAELCREQGYLTVGIVTIPFRSEGKLRINQAIDGIREIEQYVDSLLVINNERIREMYGDFPISQAFAKADDVLAIAAKGIAEIITVHGYINVDFADVETVMRNSGVAIMGTGLAEGEGRALKAVENALVSPLLNNNNIKGAKNILLNVTSGQSEITMDEIGEITDYIQKKAGFEADLIWGNGTDDTLGNQISVTVIATGFSTTCIPELLANQKPLKETHILSDSPARSVPVRPVTRPEKPRPVNEVQSSFAFENRTNPSMKSEYDLHSTATKKEQSENNPAGQQKIDFSKLTDEEIDNLETIPAYIRKQLLSDRKNPVKQVEYSNYTVSNDPRKKIIIRENNNPYIHKNVD